MYQSPLLCQAWHSTCYFMRISQLNLSPVELGLQMNRKDSGELGASIRATEIKNGSPSSSLAGSSLRPVPQHHHLPWMSLKHLQLYIREPNHHIQGSLYVSENWTQPHMWPSLSSHSIKAALFYHRDFQWKSSQELTIGQLTILKTFPFGGWILAFLGKGLLPWFLKSCFKGLTVFFYCSFL